jgi:hypothetical protein
MARQRRGDNYGLESRRFAMCLSLKGGYRTGDEKNRLDGLAAVDKNVPKIIIVPIDEADFRCKVNSLLVGEFAQRRDPSQSACSKASAGICFAEGRRQPSSSCLGNR